MAVVVSSNLCNLKKIRAIHKPRVWRPLNLAYGPIRIRSYSVGTTLRIWLDSMLLVVFASLGSLYPIAAADIASPALHLKATAKSDKADLYWPTDPVRCDFILNGEIAPGDTDELERQFKRLVGSLDSFTFFLCLRSHGGDVTEALRIAKFVLEQDRPWITTIVEDGQTCASACAFIFLAGTGPAKRGALAHRFLHPRGRLMFHSPRLDLSSLNIENLSDEEWLKLRKSPSTDGRTFTDIISDLYKDGLRDVDSVIKTFNQREYQRDDLGDPWVRPSLFLEMFSQSPDEWMCVDTVDDIGRWNIQVFGYSPPKRPSKRQYFNVCRNTYNWRQDRSTAKDEEPDPDDIKQLTVKAVPVPHEKGDTYRTRYTLPYSGAMAQLTCVIEIETYNEEIGEESQLHVHLKSEQDTVSSLGPTSFFDPETFLRDLPGLQVSHSTALTPAIHASFKTYPNAVMNGCSFKSILDLNEADCQKQCSLTPGCVAYSRSNLNGACTLKHTLTAARFDPEWTSGVSLDIGSLKQSTRSMKMTSRTLGVDKRLDGSIINTAEINDDRGEAGLICSHTCEKNSACIAAEFDSATNECVSFSSVSGLQTLQKGHTVDTYLKTQH
jgi:PAN domain